MACANPGHVPPHHRGYNFITASSRLFGLFGSLAERQTHACGFLSPLRQQLQTVRMQLEVSRCHASSGNYRYCKLSLGRHEEKFLFLQGKGQLFLPSLLSPFLTSLTPVTHSPELKVVAPLHQDPISVQHRPHLLITRGCFIGLEPGKCQACSNRRRA